MCGKKVTSDTRNDGKWKQARGSKDDDGASGSEMGVSASMSRLGRSDSRAAFLRAKRAAYARKIVD